MSAVRASWSRLKPHWPRQPERAPKLSPPAELGGTLRAFRAAALWGAALLIATAAGSAFTESYRGLFEWAEHHGFGGFWAAAFPLQVDLFIAVGELVLFVAVLDAWQRRDQAGAWLTALLGLAVSVAGNVGHIAAHDLQSRGTAAVPPVAAFGALWLGLGVLKRVLRRRQAAAVAVTRTAQAAAERDALAEVLDGLRGAVRALAERPAPEPAAATGHGALLAELLDAVRGIGTRDADAVPAPVPADAESAALASYRATHLAGNPWSQRQMEIRFGTSRGQFAKMRDAVGTELRPELTQDGPVNEAEARVARWPATVNGSTP
jgi:Protein of unknown function (DUF2637)